MHGYLYEIMKTTRHRYHYAIRHCKKNELALRKERLAQHFTGSKRDFWQEVKRTNRPKNHMPPVVDDATGAEAIAETFAQKYEELFRSVPTRNEDMLLLKQRIEDGLREGSHEQVYFSADDVRCAIRKLKPGKSDGVAFFSDHVINGGAALHEHLSLLLNSMLVHGYTPDALLASTFVSIPKNQKSSLSKSSNYRSIALCSAICKVVDLIILDKWSDRLATSNLQFGFKGNHSTVLCTAVLKEIVRHYMNKNSTVYALFLDASKAFDKVHYGRLFSLLIERNVPLLVLRFLLDSYTRQTASVTWNGARSANFCLTNGVKQGGILSPILFTIYFDELLMRLKQAGFGCHIEGEYAGALCYADDLTLLSPSLLGMNAMLEICAKFAAEYSVAFNPSKTVAIPFCPRNLGVLGTPILNGTAIAWANEVKHLGNYVQSNLDDSRDIRYKRSVFIGSVNKLISNFHFVSYEVMCRLFLTHCMSFYGSQMWQLSSSGLRALFTTWNIAVRRILKLPRRAHTWTLGPLLKTKHLKTLLLSRTLTFLKSCAHSCNSLVKAIFTVACGDARSDMGQNIAVMRSVHGIYDLTSNQCVESEELSDDRYVIVETAIEILHVRDGSLSLSVFDHDELSDILTYLLCRR